MRKLCFILLLFDVTILAVQSLLELPDKTVEFVLVAAPQAQSDNVTLWEAIQSKCEAHYHLPKPTSRLEAQMLIDRVRQINQLETDFVLPVDVIGRVDNQFHFNAFDPVTSLPLGWGDWLVDSTAFQYRFALDHQSNFNLLQSADLAYNAVSSGDIGTMTHVLCVREFRDEIFPETEHVLKSHIAATKMAFTTGKVYCQSLRSNCPFSSCSSNWNLAVPYKTDEEAYFVRLANQLWTGLSTSYEHYETITIGVDSDYNEMDVYATVNEIDDSERVWYQAAAGNMTVVCVDYKYGWQYQDINLVDVQSKQLHESTSGKVRMLMSMGTHLAKDSESICTSVHVDAEVMNFEKKQEYYDYVSKVAIPNKHLLKRGNYTWYPYIDNTKGSFPVIESTDDFTTVPTFAKFVDDNETVDLSCFLPLHNNWKSFELCQSSFRYNLLNIDRQLTIGDATRVCDQMKGEQASLVNSSDLDVFVGLMGSFTRTFDIDGVAMAAMYIGEYQANEAAGKCREFGASVPKLVNIQQNADAGFAFRALGLESVILNGNDKAVDGWGL